MLSNMIRSYRAISKNFNRPISPVFTFIGLIFIRFIAIIGNFVDLIIFPSITKQKIIKPIVIVGVPRSGTTFLQRFLVDNQLGLGMQLWKMLFPSLFLQKVIKPFLPLIEKISPARFHSNAAHNTNLLAVETDDPSLLFRYFDGFFVYGFFLAWAEKDYKRNFDPNFRDTSVRDFKWFEKVWKINLHGNTNNQVIAKLFSLGVRIPKFLEYFSDAKILYTLRDPIETVPSGLSLVTGVLDSKYGFWNLPDEKRSFYIERLYTSFLELSMAFYNDYSSGRIKKSQIKLVKYDRLMNDFEIIMNEILEFIEVIPTEQLIIRIKETSDKQKTFKSGHKYNLEKFGITEERIRKDYAKIYEELL